MIIRRHSHHFNKHIKTILATSAIIRTKVHGGEYRRIPIVFIRLMLCYVMLCYVMLCVNQPWVSDDGRGEALRNCETLKLKTTNANGPFQQKILFHLPVAGTLVFFTQGSGDDFRSRIHSVITLVWQRHALLRAI